MSPTVSNWQFGQRNQDHRERRSDRPGIVCSGRYGDRVLQLTVIAPLVPMAIGDEFQQGTVPLHLTVLPNTSVGPEIAAAVESAIREVAGITEPITARARGFASFGDAGDVRVTTVDVTAELQRLHVRLLECVQRAGGIAINPAYNGDGYRPHITHTHDHQVIRPGERVSLTAVAVLDCTQPIRRVSVMADLAGSP